MGTEMRPRSESRLPPLLSLIAGMVDLIVCFEPRQPAHCPHNRQ